MTLCLEVVYIIYRLVPSTLLTIFAQVINIVLFYEVYCDVEPKRLALQAANAELAGAQEKLAQIQVSPCITMSNYKSKLCEMDSH